jgi:hypothetical protein
MVPRTSMRASAPLRRHVERDSDDRQRNEADGDVDIEDPAPRCVVDEKAADQRSGDAAEAEDRAERALVAPAIAWRDDVADDRLREDDEPAAANALQRAERDELAHVLAQAAEGRADEEDDDRALEQALAPVEVAELAV